MSRRTVGIIVLTVACVIAIASGGVADPGTPAHPPVVPHEPLPYLEPATGPPGASPYVDWEHQGMLPAIDQQERLAEIHPRQAGLINAAYAGYEYRT
jgi:hypothetical protein